MDKYKPLDATVKTVFEVRTTELNRCLSEHLGGRHVNSAYLQEWEGAGPYVLEIDGNLSPTAKQQIETYITTGRDGSFSAKDVMNYACALEGSSLTPGTYIIYNEHTEDGN